MERYIGLDDHGSSCTFGVIGPSGRKIRHDVVETNGAALVGYLRSIPGRKHLCLEEGVRSAWLYEMLSPHVEEIVVAGIGKRKQGQKSDEVDAFRRAEEMRIGSIETSVFKAPREHKRLREVARVYGCVVGDLVRVKCRVKARYRARGVATAGRGIYSSRQREAWLRKLPVGHRWATEKLYEEHDALAALKEELEKELVKESRRHPMARVLETAPGMGPIRVAQLLPIVVTPHRFRARRQFWAYCGLGIVTRSSSDYVQTDRGGWVRARVAQTRGLNRNHNPRLKGIFKGAATTIVTRLPEDPLHKHYRKLTQEGTKPNLAKLTIARRVAALVLKMWKEGKEYEPQRLEAKQQEAIASLED